MITEGLLKPGDLVACRPDADGLIMWSSYRCDIDDTVGGVDVNDILLILKSRKPTKKELRQPIPLTEEWKVGAYQVLSSEGLVGWIGAGWAVPILFQEDK